jgi:hypothetical protein
VPAQLISPNDVVASDEMLRISRLRR